LGHHDYSSGAEYQIHCPTHAFDHLAWDHPVREVAGWLTCMAPRTATSTWPPLIMPKACAEFKHEPSATTMMSSSAGIDQFGVDVVFGGIWADT
jgi:hypothetical protein